MPNFDKNNSYNDYLQENDICDYKGTEIDDSWNIQDIKDQDFLKDEQECRPNSCLVPIIAVIILTISFIASIKNVFDFYKANDTLNFYLFIFLIIAFSIADYFAIKKLIKNIKSKLKCKTKKTNTSIMSKCGYMAIYMIIAFMLFGTVCLILQEKGRPVPPEIVEPVIIAIFASYAFFCLLMCIITYISYFKNLINFIKELKNDR